MTVFRTPDWYLVDLPGYGYARAGKAERAGLSTLIRNYISGRPNLAGMVWLLDIRREPSPEDWDMLELLADRGVPVLVSITKADKLAHGARATRRRELVQALALADDQVQLTSSTSGLGIPDLGDSILGLLRAR